MDLGIHGRSAIVTGGSRGIGRETARVLLEAGARVAICARNRETLDQARGDLQAKTGGEVLTIVADMAVEADAERLARETTARLGGVDILVNNTGQMYSGRFDALTEAGLRTQLDIKLFGFMRAIRLVAPGMKARRWGRIVNIIGGAGKEPDPYMLGSGIVNSALLNITKSLSTELGADNVLVNAVCPGWVDTGMWKRNVPGLVAELGAGSEDEARRLAARKNALGAGAVPRSWRTPSRSSARSAPASSPASPSTSTVAASRASGRIPSPHHREDP